MAPMTTVPPGPYQQPAPRVPVSETGGKKVSPAGYWIAGAIFLVGGIAALVWFVVVIVGAINAPNDFARVRVPGQMRVELGTGEWYLYHEAPGIQDSRGSFPAPNVVVTDPAGDKVLIRSSGTSYNYETTDHEGESIGSFEARTAGVYTVEVSGTAAPGRSVAVGRSLFSGAVPGILGSIGLGAVAFLVALVLLIVTLVRRGKAKRARALATGYPGGSAGLGGYPAPGYPNPGYPNPSYPAPAYPAPAYPAPAPSTPPPPSAPPAPQAPPAPPAPQTPPASPGWAAPQPPPPSVPPAPPAPSAPSTPTAPSGPEGTGGAPEPESPPSWSPPSWSPPGDERDTP